MGVRQKILFRLIVLGIVIGLVGCDHPPPSFLWTPEKKLTALSQEEEELSLSLKSWIRQAPFTGERDPYDGRDDGQVVITNEKVIFPFLDGWFTADGSFPVNQIFRQYDKVIFEDTTWGTTVVWAGIKNTMEPVFLDQSYYETMDFLTPGAHLGVGQMSSSSVNFSQTVTVSVNQDSQERTAILWGSRSTYNPDFLIGFIERGHLVLMVAFPCKRDQHEACAVHMGKVSKALSLDIQAWEELDENGLKSVRDRDFFYKEREKRILAKNPDTFFSAHWITVPLNGTPFALVADNKRSATFQYQSEEGAVNVTFESSDRPSGLGEQSINDYLANKYAKQTKYRIEFNPAFGPDHGRIMYFKEEERNGRMYVTGWTQLSTMLTSNKNKRILKVVYDFPAGYIQGRTMAEKLLTRIDF